MIIKEYQEPGKALADAMRRYGDKGSQALADSIYSSVQLALQWLRGVTGSP